MIDEKSTSTPLEVEADNYSDDLLRAVVSCPTCGKQHTCNADSWKDNVDGIFAHQSWYRFNCVACSQSVAFMLAFEVVRMESGKPYIVVRPAHSFGVIDGELVNFKEDCMHVLVMPKPATVIVDDGEFETIEPLPPHLAKPDWYKVRYVDIKRRDGKPFWLNTKGCQIKEIKAG